MLTKIKKYVALTLVLVTFFSMNSVIANGSRSKGQSDASYANFRNVRAGRIGVNNLYRSQHPANGSSRSVYANKLAKKYGIPVIAFAGGVTKDATACNGVGIDAFFPILRGICTLEEAMKIENAYANMADTAEQVFRLFALGCK